MKPFVTCVTDYHEFETIRTAIQHEHRTIVLYEELGCGYSSLNFTGNPKYHAVFYHEGYSKNRLEPVILKWKTRIHERD
jgi:hypothetical protein